MPMYIQLNVIYKYVIFICVTLYFNEEGVLIRCAGAVRWVVNAVSCRGVIRCYLSGTTMAILLFFQLFPPSIFASPLGHWLGGQRFLLLSVPCSRLRRQLQTGTLQAPEGPVCKLWLIDVRQGNQSPGTWLAIGWQVVRRHKWRC